MALARSKKKVAKAVRVVAASGNRLSRDELSKVHAYWRACNYLSAGMIYLQDNPLQRAARTCELAGFRSLAEVDQDLIEWDYGEYEGLRPAEIRARRADWQIFRDGCPGGESPADVAVRADRVVGRARKVNGNVLIFSSGHFIRVLTVRWLGLEPSVNCSYLMLSTASLSAVGYKRDLSHPVIWLWNDDHHVGE